jgi:hypothetical protein
MKNLIKLTLTLTLLLVFVLGGFSQVTYDVDKTVDFSQYKTYSFLGWQKDSDTLLNDLDKETILNAFKTEFQERGLQYVEEDGEMMVSLYLVIDNKKQVQAYTNYTGAYGMARPWGFGAVGYGGIAGGTANTTFSTYDYQVGTLILDSFDGPSKKLIWQGIYKGDVQEKAQKRDKTIPKHISALLKNFPIKPVN